MINSFESISFCIFIIKICIREIIFLLKENVEVIPIVTALIALFGLLVTTLVKAGLDWKVNQLKIESEVISKSRVEWLDIVRNNTAEFIESYYEYINDFILDKKLSGNNTLALSKSQSKYNKAYWKLRLYYTVNSYNNGENKDHKIICEKLDNFNKVIEKFITKYNKNPKGKFDTDELESNLKVFVEESSKYFKKVWEEAKNNK